MANIIKTISEELLVPEELLNNALDFAYIRYKKRQIPKKSGGTRTIIQPTSDLKLIQRWLIEKIFKKLPISSVASAFQQGSSILKNATRHQNSRYSVRIDLENFFPSIKSNDIIQTIINTELGEQASINNEIFKQVLKKACFDRNDLLPVGYPCSPIIANAVMTKVDDSLLGIINSNNQKFGIAYLTRYADDFIFFYG